MQNQVAKCELDRQQQNLRPNRSRKRSEQRHRYPRLEVYEGGGDCRRADAWLKQSILSGQTKVSKADMHRLAKAAYHDRTQTLQDILHPELKVEPKPDADGVIRVPGKAPVMPFRKVESVYDSDAYPEDVRYEYVALEELTTRFRISFSYQLEQMPDNAQRDVILEIIHKHKDYLTSLEAALADVKEQTA